MRKLNQLKKNQSKKNQSKKNQSKKNQSKKIRYRGGSAQREAECEHSQVPWGYHSREPIGKMPCNCAVETQDLDCVGENGTEICNNYSPSNCEAWSRHGSSYKQHMCLGKGVVSSAMGAEPNKRKGQPRIWYDDEKWTSFYDYVQQHGLSEVLNNCSKLEGGASDVCNAIKRQLD